MSVAMTVEKLAAFLDAAPRFAAPTVVTGHAAPDTDAAISALMEAWRRYETAGEPALPIVRCDRLPAEIAWLCGPLAARLPLGDTPALADATRPVVLTDTHADPLFAGRVRAVVDHHIPAPHAVPPQVDAEIRRVGATATLVARRFREQGLLPDPTVARLLLGAVWMDTDGLSSHKATAWDTDISDWLSVYSDTPPAALYAAMRERLLSERDVPTLYRRDRRLYYDADGTPSVAFAILKVRRDAMPDRATVRRLLAEDAAACGARVCVAKIVLYDEDDRREEYYIATGAAASILLERVAASAGAQAVRTAPDEVYLPYGCWHYGRKWYAQRFGEWL